MRYFRLEGFTLFTALALALAACSSPEIEAPVGEEPVPVDTYDELLSLTVGPAGAVCIGEAVALQGAGAGGVAPHTYNWSATPDCGGCISDPSSPNTTASPQVPTRFDLEVRDASGNVLNQSVQLDVLLAPAADAGPDQFVDPGTEISLGDAANTGGTRWSCNRSDCALSSDSAAQPTAQPTRSTRYTLTVTDPNGCSAASETTVWVNLRAVATLPEDGDLSWPVSARLLVQFDQPLDPASLTADNVVLTDADDEVIPVQTELAGNGRFLYVTPGAGYASGVDYLLTLVGGPGGLRSLDPVLPSTMASDVVVEFTTGGVDKQAPSFIFRLPGVDAVDVPMNTAIVATTDEPLDPLTVKDSTFWLTSAGGGWAGELSYDMATRTIVLRPGLLLTAFEKYTVHARGLADMSGNTMDTRWSFTTDDRLDTTAPEVISISPADGEVGVSVNSAVVVTFSELVDGLLPGGLVVRNVATGEPAKGVVSFDPVRSQVRWVPVGLLGSQTHYSVTVNNFRDMAGNQMTAPFTSTFTTRQILFFDSFDQGTAKWTLAGGWGDSIRRYRSPNASLADSPLGRYSPNALGWAVTATPINVAGLSQVSVDYAARLQSERKVDLFRVYYRLDGRPWVLQREGSGNSGWLDWMFSVDPAGAKKLELKFEFTSNDRRQRHGVYIDDLVVQTP